MRKVTPEKIQRKKKEKTNTDNSTEKHKRKRTPKIIIQE